MRRLISILIVCACVLSAHAANVLTLSSASGAPGDTVLITASLANTDAPVAAEVILPLGGRMHYAAGSALLASARSNGHSISAIEANDTLYVNIFSMTLSAFRGTEGELFRFSLVLGNEPAAFALAPEVMLASQSGASLEATVEQGSATILAPKMEILTTTVDYGHQPIRQTYTQYITLRNAGTMPMHISSLTMPSDRFSYDGQARTIQAGGEESIAIDYHPTARGAYSGILTVHSDATNGNLRTGSEIRIEADPFSVNELHIANAEGNSEEDLTISISVNNMEPLAGAQFSIVLPHSLEYVSGSAVLSSRAQHMSLVQTTSGDTLTLMAYSALNDTLRGNDGELLTFRIRLNGEGNWFSLDPQDVFLSNRQMENMTSAVYGGYVQFASPYFYGEQSLSFGSHSVTGTAQATYTIQNWGSVALTVDRATFLSSDSFRIVEPLPLTIAPNSVQTITVEHTPSVEGEFATTMQLYTNDPARRMVSVALSGEVYEPNGVSLLGELTDEGYLLHVSLANYSAIVGMQMDIRWLDSMQAELRPTARLAQHTTTLIPLGGGEYRMMAFSMQNKQVQGSDGELFSVLFSGQPIGYFNHSVISLDSIFVSDAASSQRLTARDRQLEVDYSALITFRHFDGTELQSSTLDYGVMPEYEGEEPSREATAQYTYTFVGWQPALAAVSGPAEYTARFDSVVNRYPVRFEDYDGTLLQADSVAYGSRPAYTGTAPHRDATAQYTYSFHGWTPSITTVAAAQLYTAVYDSVVNRYRIRFSDYEGTLLKADSVAYGSMPQAPADPVRENNAQYTYSFMGWTPAVAAVVADADYVARYDSVVNRYAVRFLNYDGAALQTDTLPYGAMPEYVGNAPQKPATAQYTYTFTGWSPTLAAVAAAADYTAQFDSVVNRYEVVFADADGTILQRDTLPYGAMPGYRGTTPQKPADAHYTYTFAGWSSTIVAVSADIVYTAVYSNEENQYMVYFLNYDGTTLQSGLHTYGTTPQYTGATPEKPATVQYTYTFSGWQPTVSEVVGAATYVAQFDSVVNSYTVVFVNHDGTVLQTDTLPYGDVPAYNGTTPEKASDVQYDYAFDSWSPALSAVAGEATYTAVFRSSLRAYSVVFLNYDGAQLQSSSEAYGTMPQYTGATPEKPATAQYTYSFTGWEPALALVSGEATYTAQFDSVVNQYPVVYVDHEGVELQRDTLPYGAMPGYRGATPVKASDVEFTYTFAGWSPDEAIVTGAATYTAVFSATTNKYGITFVNYDGTLLQTVRTDYGTMPQYTGATPEKPATAQYTYTFSGWAPALAPVAGEATYTAQFDSVVNQYQITFVNFDGTILQTSLVDYGTIPHYDGSEPVRTATEQYSYTFTGWQPALYAVDKDEVYRAQFEETVNTFTVTFVDYDGTVLLTETVEYGQAATAPADPVREGYQFTGWSADFSHVTSDLTVTAQYELLNALEQIELSAPAEKFYRDGHFFIRKQGRIYDFNGRLIE